MQAPTRTTTAYLILIFCLAFSTGSRAAEGDWEFVSDLYLWGANIDIEAENGTNTEIRFTDIVEDFELG